VIRRLVLAALVLLAATSTADATPLAAGPPGGGVQSILVAPSDMRIAYIATAGSLFRTQDGGRHWRLVPQALRTPVTLFAVDPARPSTLYGGLEFPGGGSPLVARLVVSRDAGAHWRRLFGRVRDPGWLRVDPRHPQTLYALATSFAPGRPPRWLTSIWRSADGGRHWHRVRPFGELAFDARGALILGAKGLYRSRDHGRTWQRIHVGVRFVDTLLADPTRPGTLYVSVDGTGAPGIRRSRDGGASWTPVASGYFDQLAMDPRVPSTLYGTTQLPAHLWRTLNGGRRWQTADRGIDVGFGLGPIALGAGPPSRVYLSTGGATEGGRAPGGVQVSADRGGHWRPTGPGLVSSSVVAAATAARCPARLYAVTGRPDFIGEGSHLYASADGARTWTIPAAGPPTRISGPSGPAVFMTSLGVDAGDPRTAYAGASTGLWRTTDAGRRWARLEAGPTSVDRLFADPRQPGVVFASTPSPSDAPLDTPRRLVVTRDGGATWAPTGLAPPGQVALTAMAFDPERAGVLYAATRAPSDDLPVPPRVGDGVFASADGGATWAALNAGLGDTHIGALALDPRHPARLYAATENHGLYRSTDAGRSWRRVGRGPIPGQRRVNVLAVNPATSDLYAANGVGALGNGDWGLWRSADGGRSWSPVSPNHLHAVVSGISIDATGTYLDAATYGLGVVRIPLRSGPAPRCRG
jgi:photosystem II stability/assembly factor-like uncharacterized protein